MQTVHFQSKQWSVELLPFSVDGGAFGPAPQAYGRHIQRCCNGRCQLESSPVTVTINTIETEIPFDPIVEQGDFYACIYR